MFAFCGCNSMEKYKIGQLNKKTVKPVYNGNARYHNFFLSGKVPFNAGTKVRILGTVKISVEISFPLCPGSI
jgi:hypothetical protein